MIGTSAQHLSRPLVAVAAALLFPLAVGCSDPSPADMAAHVVPETGVFPETAAPGAGGLRIGLVPEQDIFRQLERYEPLGRYLSARIGVQVRLQMVPAYSRIVDGFEVFGLDGAFLGSLAYLVAHERVGVTVLARPEELDGSSSYHGLIFTRRDSGIRGVEQMRGRRFVFVDRTTTAGYLLPLHYFRDRGVDDYTTLLAESYFAGTHEDAILDVLNGVADVGAAKNTVFERLAAEQPSLLEELEILETSPDVPANALAVRRDLDPRLQSALQTALLEMHEDPRGLDVLAKMGLRRFIPTTDADYAPLYRYAAEVGSFVPRFGDDDGKR